MQFHLFPRFPAEWPRRETYLHYRQRNPCSASVTQQVDVTVLKRSPAPFAGTHESQYAEFEIWYENLTLTPLA